MSRRHYNNTAQPTSLTSPVSSAASGHVETIDVVSTSGWPTVPFSAAIDRGTSDEEAILVTAVTSTTMTVSRGFDGTASPAHLAGASVEHCLVTADLDDANAHVWDDTRDDHSQYYDEDRLAVMLPKTFAGTSTVVNPIDASSYSDCGSISITSAPFDRKVQFSAQISMNGLNTGVTYRSRIIRGSSTVYAAAWHYGVQVITHTMVSEWVIIPAGESWTVKKQVKRDSGSGGELDNDSALNKFSALVVPA